MDGAVKYNLRTALSQISRVSHDLNAQLALATPDPTLAVYVEAAATFKEHSDLTLARFRIALQEARNAEEAALNTSEDKGLEEKGMDQGKVGKEERDGEKVVEIDQHCHERCGACLKEIADTLTDDFELRLQTRILPSMQADFQSTVEEDIAAIEPRVLKRLEQRVAKYSYSHPMMVNIYTIMTRRLAPTIIREAEFELYVRIKDRLLQEFGDVLSLREKDALSVSTMGASQPPPYGAQETSLPTSHQVVSDDNTESPIPRGCKRSSPATVTEGAEDGRDDKRERVF
ncbi:hypothetical protein K466DRAFT_582864 [Polyporus arcularius HHB13444]|uniref:Uncharacterized protein n=1 Tax=Polyporus arcularius HHB13444 TaxID=1314778 RepID=A0A5C3PS17_9APHY|nr:hypothetical protein K466DRAFT_582864 [Polyporus arcularius HHB13444]